MAFPADRGEGAGWAEVPGARALDAVTVSRTREEYRVPASVVLGAGVPWWESVAERESGLIARIWHRAPDQVYVYLAMVDQPMGVSPREWSSAGRASPSGRIGRAGVRR